MGLMCTYYGVDRATLNRTCDHYTAFATFEELLAADGYRPSLDISIRALLDLADAYDLEMEYRKDPRRAYRYGGRKLEERGRGTLYVNQGLRDADVVTIRNGKALIGYTMPNGRDYLWEVDDGLTWEELRYSIRAKYRTVSEKVARKRYPDLFN